MTSPPPRAETDGPAFAGPQAADQSTPATAVAPPAQALARSGGGVATSPGCSITVRVETTTAPMAIARLSQAVAEASGAITALDVAESTEERLVVDTSCNAGRSAAITKAPAALPDCTVVEVSDRTFPMRLGGKIEVTPKVPLRHRDDLSREYTPGVARVCPAIAENPADVRHLTIKRNRKKAPADADVFIDVSGPNLLDEADVAAMAPRAVVLALANPVPEVHPVAAHRHAVVVATGRSDYPNAHISDTMLTAAANAIAIAGTGRARRAQRQLHHPQRLHPDRLPRGRRGGPPRDHPQ